MVELVFHVSVKELCHCFPAEGKHATIIINRTTPLNNIFLFASFNELIIYAIILWIYSVLPMLYV